MCRLFGLRANKEVDIEFSFHLSSTSFKSLGEKNPDGWGVGWYKNGKPQVEKEPISAADSTKVQRINKSMMSDVFISHVRKATNGDATEENCHPFLSGQWLFAHNGSIDRSTLLDKLEASYRQALKGCTDSEVYFQWILQNIDIEGSVESGIKTSLKAVRKLSHTGLNFILTDGQTLYCYRESSKNQSYYTLYYLERDPNNYGPATFRSEELGTILHSKALNGEKAVLVCSEELTEEENWKLIPLKNLLIIPSDLKVRLMEVE